MNSNLPPGVTDSMIPGNRPQDAEFEHILDSIAVFMEDGLERSEYHDKSDIPDILCNLLAEYEVDADSEFLKEQGLDIEE